MNDFARLWSAHGEELTKVFQRVGASAHYILGAEVEAFEKAFAAHWGLAHCVGVANGMDAIEIGLRAAGLKPGEKVLTTPNSAFATTLAIVRAGGTPVFTEVDDHGLMDLDDAENIARAEKIRFLVPVHLYGICLDMDRLRNLRDNHRLLILEDCAQSVGAAWQSAKEIITCGTVGFAAATSFYPTKNLGALGDGGALLTSDPAIAAAARSLRNYGQSEKYVHTELGLNSRLDELQAALLNHVFLPQIQKWTARRQALAAMYSERIRSKKIRLPKPSGCSRPVWHLYPVFVDNQREAFLAHMKRAGVSTGIHYPIAIPEQAALKGLNVAAPSTARKICAQQVSLPIHPYLSDSEANTILDAVNTF